MAKGIDWSRILASAYPIVLMYFIAHGHVAEYIAAGIMTGILNLLH